MQVLHCGNGVACNIWTWIIFLFPNIFVSELIYENSRFDLLECNVLQEVLQKKERCCMCNTFFDVSVEKKLELNSAIEKRT